MQKITIQKPDKSVQMYGFVGILLIFNLLTTSFAQNNSDDRWNNSKLVLTTVNAEVLLHPSTGNGPFQNMAYGFKVGKNTIRKCGWYLGAMTNFRFFGAFKAADEGEFYPKEWSTSFLEADAGLTFHVYKPLSYHIGTGYFYRTTNYKDLDYKIVHQRGMVAHGIVLSTGFTWHLELSDKYIRDKSPEKLSLSAEFVSLISFNSANPDRFSYGVKLGVGICNAKKEIQIKEKPHETEPPTPVIAENKEIKQEKEKKEKEVETEKQETGTKPLSNTPDSSLTQKPKEIAQNPTEQPKEEPAVEAKEESKVEPEPDPRVTRVAPKVEINVPSDISEYSLYVSALLRDEGSSEVTKRGFVYTRYGTPTLGSESKSLSVDSRNVMFGDKISDLQPATTYSIRAYAINDADTSYSEVISVKTKDILSIGSIYDLKPESVTIVFNNVNSDGAASDVVRRGLCYADSSVTTMPTVANNVVEKTATDNLFKPITGLTLGKHYYMRAFTEKADGTVDYSDTVSVITPLYLSTHPVTNIGSNTATAGGTIVYNLPETSILVAGTCWSLKNPNPTTNNTRSGDAVIDGRWASSMENLKPNTTYYVRAYVVTGSNTYYGNVVTFTTLP